MSLLAMCCYDTEENGRSKYTDRVLESLMESVDFTRHRLFVVDNGSCDATKKILKNLLAYQLPNNIPNIKVIYSEKNLGTAEAINLAWKYANEGECLIKMDNDIIVHSKGWVDEMEECIKREPTIGILGLKRNDLEENPSHHVLNWRSELVMLPHEAGQTWLVVEKVKHVMGSCVMINPKLFQKIGYLFQNGIYGLDDSDYAQRSLLAGFINAFIPNIHIDHIDDGASQYSQEKRDYAGERLQEFGQRCADYISGKRPLYYNPFQK